MTRGAVIAVALALVAAGCAGREGMHDAGESRGALARIDLSYTRTFSTGSAEPRFDAQGRFVRFSAFEPGSMTTILGFTDFAGIPLDRCSVIDGATELDEALSTAPGSSAEVALLDAGRLELRGPVDHALLHPHHYPDLVPFVSGVVYGGDETSPLALGLGQRYQVTAEGGAEVGPFVAAVNAPPAFPSPRPEPLVRGADLPVRWIGEPGATEPLLIEIKWSSRLGSRAVRCRAVDDGELLVSRAAFDSLPAAAALISATVTLERVARAPLVAPGAGGGELTFALKDVSALQVAP